MGPGGRRRRGVEGSAYELRCRFCGLLTAEWEMDVVVGRWSESAALDNNAEWKQRVGDSTGSDGSERWHHVIALCHRLKLQEARTGQPPPHPSSPSLIRTADTPAMLAILRSRSSAGNKRDTSAKSSASGEAQEPTSPQTDGTQSESLDAATSPAPPVDSAAALSPSDGTPSSNPGSTAGSAGHQPPTAAKSPPRAARRLSWRPFARTSNSPADAQPTSQAKEKTKPTKLATVAAHPPLVRTRSEKQAQESALLLRELIVGPSSNPPNKLKSKARSSAEVEKVKAQLARPKTAGKVIAQLRQLSSSDEPVVVGKGANGETLTGLPKGPIHAVCLPYTDAEAQDRHFARLATDKPAPGDAQEGATRSVSVHLHTQSTEAEICSVANASITSLQMVFSEVNLVSLVTTPDLGLGGPPDGPGILSGALPSAQAIIQGVEQITPQLMALGYATGKAVMPDHAGA